MPRPENLCQPRWKIALDRTLEELWAAGETCSAIAEHLEDLSARKVSRNAVAGRRRRLKLPSRPSPIRDGVP